MSYRMNCGGDGVKIGIFNNDYCKHDPEKEDCNTQEFYWSEANGLKWP